MREVKRRKGGGQGEVVEKGRTVKQEGLTQLYAGKPLYTTQGTCKQGWTHAAVSLGRIAKDPSKVAVTEPADGIGSEIDARLD